MIVPPDLNARLEALDALLTGRGDLIAKWRKTLYEVPRHLFIPTRGWASPNDDRDDYPIDRDKDSAGWLDAVYSNSIIITQVDDGLTDPITGKGAFTSSCSAPSAVYEFLKQLNVLPPQNILDIGTGTGWTAGLLSARVGDQNVTSIEIDSDLSATAAKNLKGAGFSPRLIVGDGSEGWAEGAPYDRIHVTCAVRQIPYAWIKQARPGAVIVTPYDPGFGYGYLARLHVQPDGSAIGYFPALVGFMMLRSQRHAAGPLSSFQMDIQGAQTSATVIDPRQLVRDSYDADLAISALAPGIQYRVEEHDDESATVYLLETVGHFGSWAKVEYRIGQREFEVIQNGDRCLWDEVVSAYFTWTSWGRPDRSRFGITVTNEHQNLWLDTPDKVVGMPQIHS